MVKHQSRKPRTSFPGGSWSSDKCDSVDIETAASALCLRQKGNWAFPGMENVLNSNAALSLEPP